MTIAVVVAALVALAPQASVQAPVNGEPVPMAIPVEMLVPFDPRPVLAEGLRHLIYELHLSNLSTSPLHLLKLEVLDADSGTVLSAIEGENLGSLLSRPGGGVTPDKAVISGGQRTIVYLDVVTPSSSVITRGLAHRLTFEPVSTINLALENVISGGRVTVAAQSYPQLGSPLRGGCWVASHGLSNQSSHRRTVLTLNGRATIAQRFAIDWIRVGSDHQAYRGDPAVNANWSPYDAEVLAVADGKVVEALDSVPDNDPTSDTKAVPITLKTVGGNHTVISIGLGRYAFYAHLKPGSLTVHLGDFVHRGQVIGHVGNSGQSDAPHLHLHIVDGSSPLAAEGLPLVFSSFWLQGHLPSLKVLTDGTGWVPTMKPEHKFGEMPLEGAVVSFATTDARGCTNR